MLTLRRGSSELERRDLETGFSETITTVPERRPAPAWARRSPGEFVFAQWNIGHFCFGRSVDTNVSPSESAERAAAYRRQLDAIGADCVGVCELSPNFDTGGGKSRELVFGRYPQFAAGPHIGYRCNAIASAEGALDCVSAKDNVLVRGFDIIEVGTADDALLLSDHRILACRCRATANAR